jgi:hypothetical protein
MILKAKNMKLQAGSIVSLMSDEGWGINPRYTLQSVPSAHFSAMSQSLAVGSLSWLCTPQAEAIKFLLS